MKLERRSEYPVDYDSLERYLNQGIMPGGFYTALLENNLAEAFGRADYHNSQNLKEIVQYIWNFFPGDAWGSKTKVEQFLIRFEAKTA